MLGISPLPEKGDYFAKLEKYAERLRTRRSPPRPARWRRSSGATGQGQEAAMVEKGVSDSSRLADCQRETNGIAGRRLEAPAALRSAHFRRWRVIVVPLPAMEQYPGTLPGADRPRDAPRGRGQSGRGVGGPAGLSPLGEAGRPGADAGRRIGRRQRGRDGLCRGPGIIAARAARAGPDCQYAGPTSTNCPPCPRWLKRSTSASDSRTSIALEWPPGTGSARWRSWRRRRKPKGTLDRCIDSAAAVDWDQVLRMGNDWYDRMADACWQARGDPAPGGAAQD